jgi:hypothetical protein
MTLITLNKIDKKTRLMHSSFVFRGSSCGHETNTLTYFAGVSVPMKPRFITLTGRAGFGKIFSRKKCESK